MVGVSCGDALCLFMFAVIEGSVREYVIEQGMYVCMYAFMYVRTCI